MASVPTWQACQTVGLECVMAVWGESYHEIVVIFVLSFVFFAWLIKPEDPPKRSRERRRRTQPAEQETRRVQRPRDATQTPARDERRAPPVVERGAAAAAASHAPTTRVNGLKTDSTAVERPVERVERPSAAQRLQRPRRHSTTGPPAEALHFTRKVSSSWQTPSAAMGPTLHSRNAAEASVAPRSSPKVSPRSHPLREAKWQSGTRFYSNVVARQQEEVFATYGGPETQTM